MKSLVSFLLLMWLTLISYAVQVNKTGLCPIRRYIEPLSPTLFSERFYGDTIIFSVRNADKVLFETFKLLRPDTLWIKKRPDNKIPQEHEHFNLVTHFSSIPGWGVNAHRQYTPGTALEQNQFIFRGSNSETVPYLGTFRYIILEDVASGKLIKWDYTKNENNTLIIFSPSIMRHLSLMKGVDFIVEKDDSTFIPVKCVDVAFSITINSKEWKVNLDTDFTNKLVSHNWSPRFYLKNDENKIITE